MKIQLSKWSILTALGLLTLSVLVVIWFSVSSEQRNMIFFMMTDGEHYENYKEYQVVQRNEVAPSPTSFKPMVAKSTDSDYNSNIVAITEVIKNEKSKMLKRAIVQPTGIDNYQGWNLIAVEGFEEGVDNFGPSPLSYMTTGVAANLHTQVLRAAKVLNMKLDSVKVEVLNKFHWENMMSASAVGFLDETHTNIIITSSESEKSIRNLKEIALNAWSAGEGLKNATPIKASLIVKKEHWKNYRATPGTTLSDESYTDGFKITDIINGPKKSDYLEQSVDTMSDNSLEKASNLVFEILAISESANNLDRPSLKKVTVSFNTAHSETWELYADEIHGIKGKPMAPTSLEYLTAGTAMCLTSQLTLVAAMLDLDYSDFRVEQQIDYRQENINTPKMAGYADLVHTNVLVESNESKERLKRFYEQSLSMCFAGEGFKGATSMYTNCYLNGKLIK